MFISILITLYINRQQAINSKSINDISSGEDIDLAIFFSRRCKGSRKWGGIDMSRRDKNLGKKWVNFNVVDMDGKLAMDTTEYSRERRLYADYLTYSRLLAHNSDREISYFWIRKKLFLICKRSALQKKVCILQTEKEKRVIYSSGHTSRKFVQPKEQRQQKKNNE